jgi:hypothetical protein
MKAKAKPKLIIAIGYVYKSGNQHRLILGYTKDGRIVYAARSGIKMNAWGIGDVCSEQWFAKVCSVRLEKVEHKTLLAVIAATQANKRIGK